MMFNVGEAKEEQSYELLPDGKYEVEVTNAEMKNNDKGDTRLNVTLTVSEGKFKGRKLWDSPWLQHSNEKATSFGHSRIKSIMAATGNDDFSFSSSDDFLAKTMGTCFDINVGRDTYNDKTKNKVTFVFVAKEPADNSIGGGHGTTTTVDGGLKSDDVPSLDDIPF